MLSLRIEIKKWGIDLIRYTVLFFLSLFLIGGSLWMLLDYFIPGAGLLGNEELTVNFWMIIASSMLIGVFSLRRAYQLYKIDTFKG